MRVATSMTAAGACDASLVDAMRSMAAYQESARVVAEHGVLFVTGKSRFPSPYSNVAFPFEPTVDAAALLDAAASHFTDRRHFVWARDELAVAVEPLARSRGFTALGPTPGMVIDAPVPEKAAPALEVRRVEDAAAFADFVRVSALAYAEAGLPKEIAESLLAVPGPAIADADVFVARAAGTPLAAALSITNAESGVAGVYWVGTVPEARRKGAADAVTRAVTNAAFRRGARVVTLQASEMGEPVYRAMGYRVVCRYERWLSPSTKKPG